MSADLSTSISDALRDDRIAVDFFAHDRAALEHVYLTYGRALYSAARSVLGNDANAQDCVHDALLRIWQRGGCYSPERGSLRALLLTCVRNEAITRKRNETRHHRIEIRSARLDFALCDGETHDVIDRGRLRDALMLLPVEQRKALALAYFHHLSHAEIAKRLKEPLGTVKGRLRLAVAKLQSAMNRP
jgi:RNA polymerase sigma-70 factor (ECF subfamily)